MAITAAEVKKLRDATGAGMMDAKKALTEADGDFDKAVEILRVSGAAKAAKRADRDASNGLVANAGGALIQLAAETDFVAKNAEFMDLAQQIAQAADAAKADGVEAVNALTLGDKTVADAVHELAVKIGEKLELSNAAYLDGQTAVYLHRRASDLPPQVGVMVAGEAGDTEVLRGVALQVASMRPQYVSRDEVPSDVVENERRIAEAKSREEGKPEAALPKIVEGRLNGFFKEVCLVDQQSITDDKKSVGQQLDAAGAKVTRFVRFEAAGA
ncbi:translation elongation factor Ts [Ammonicoccus fulvus]|uniref:Elongation factor Ts n=1 Tax=Ammonicoccus fulvus TaxID=3138240 RepID=A0ABZ3FRE4_9ACTN